MKRIIGRMLLLLFMFIPLYSHANKLMPLMTENEISAIGSKLYIRLFKEENILELYVLKQGNYHLLKQYDICTYSGGLGPKQRHRDNKSPEGFYRTTTRELNPNSQFHLSFGIGYPNQFDRSHGYTGSLLMVHGQCASTGCYAMGNANIEVIYYLVSQALSHGQKAIDIHIFPFKMTEQNMDRYKYSDHYSFWQQLKPAYDYFNAFKIPPKILVQRGMYVVIPKIGKEFSLTEVNYY